MKYLGGVIGIAAATLLILSGPPGTSPPKSHVVPPAKAAATPGLRLTGTRSAPGAEVLDLRGRFDDLVLFLEEMSNTKQVLIPELRLAHAEAKESSSELQISISVVPESPFAPADSIARPLAHANRLRALRSALPKKAWLDSYVQSGGSIKIEGAASDDEEVAAFLTTLHDTPCLFSDLALYSAERMESGIGTHFIFTASARPCS